MAQPNWPTHHGSAAFWEELGRTVATFGMLEDTLGMALCVVTGQEPAAEGEALQRQLNEWAERVLRNLKRALCPLANQMEAAWATREGGLTENQAAIIAEDKALAKERNRLCHGAWIAFGRGDEGTVRYFPRKDETRGGHLKTRSLQALAETRERVAGVTKAVIADTEALTNRPFPGKGQQAQQPA